MDREKIFWQFLRDLKDLGSDVKGQVIYGGCSWREPSPIPGAVKRLKELNWEDIDDSLASVLCNEIAKTKLKNKVAELFNYHRYDLDLDCSADEKERFYAGWLNRFILICAEAGMADMFEEKEEKDTTDSGGEPQQYTEGLKELFNEHVMFIGKLQGMKETDMVKQVIKWSGMHTEGKPICKANRQSDYARELVRNGIVKVKDDDEAGTIEKLRRRFSYYETEKKKKKRG